MKILKSRTLQSNARKPWLKTALKKKNIKQKRTKWLSLFLISFETWTFDRNFQKFCMFYQWFTIAIYEGLSLLRLKFARENKWRKRFLTGTTINEEWLKPNSIEILNRRKKNFFNNTELKETEPSVYCTQLRNGREYICLHKPTEKSNGWHR